MSLLSDAEERRQPSLDAVKGSSMSGEQNTSLYVWRAEYEFLCLASRIRVFYVWRAEYKFGVKELKEFYSERKQTARAHNVLIMGCVAVPCCCLILCATKFGAYISISAICLASQRKRRIERLFEEGP